MLIASRTGHAEEQEAESEPAPQAAPPEDDLTTKVQQLASLHTQGLLTDDEFAAAKAKALGI